MQTIEIDETLIDNVDQLVLELREDLDRAIVKINKIEFILGRIETSKSKDALNRITEDVAKHGMKITMGTKQERPDATPCVSK